MVYMTGCCCYSNTKDGSFTCAIYTGVMGAITSVICMAALIERGTLFVSGYIFRYSESLIHNIYLAFLIERLLLAIFSVLLAIGVKKDKRNYFMPWILVMAIECMGRTVLLISAIGVVMDYGPVTIMWFMLLVLEDFVINFYLILCVGSQYKLLGFEASARKGKILDGD